MVRLSGIVRDLLLKFRGRQRQQAETSGQGTKIKIQVCPLCKQIKKHDRWEALTIYDEVYFFKNRGNWKAFFEKILMKNIFSDSSNTARGVL